MLPLREWQKYASQLGYKILLCNSYFNRSKEIDYFRMLTENKVDGIILASRNLDINSVISNRLPLVTIDRILGGDIPCVFQQRKGRHSLRRAPAEKAH